MSRIHRLERSQLVLRPLEDVFAFFSDAANLEALTPPFLGFSIETPLPIEMRKDTRIDYSLALYGIPVRWRTRITVWEPELRFVDEQESGPYALWRHTHEFERRDSSTLVRDTVDYRVGFGPLGWVARRLFVAKMLERIFEFRRDAVERLLHPAKTP